MFLKYFWKLVFATLYVQIIPTDASYIQSLIASSINKTNAPCENFYSYACGCYVQEQIAANSPEIISYLDLKYNEHVFETITNMPPQKHSFVEKTIAYLKACRGESKRNLTRYFEEVKPAAVLNWPILEQVTSKAHNETYQWPSDREFELWPLLGKLQAHGLNNVLVNQELVVDKNGEINIMMEPPKSDSDSTLPDATVLQVLLMGLGVKRPAKIMQNLKQVNKVLMNILKVYSQADEKSLELSYGDLELVYPNLNLNLYLQELLGKELPADTFILLRNPSYFRYLNENIWLAFKKQQLCDYLMMKFLYFVVTDSTTDFQSMSCVKDLRNKFDLAVNFLFYHQLDSDKFDVVADLQEMFAAVVNMLAQLLEINYLKFRNSQVKVIMNKLLNVRLNVGNLPRKATLEKIEEFYRNVPSLDASNYYKNHLLMLRHRFAKSLHYKQNQTNFIVSDNKVGSSTGAFYVPQQNLIVLPFGILLHLLYDLGYSHLHKYSLLGFILAHELVHAFDTHGLNFNGLGQFAANNSAMLGNAKFQSSLKCLQSQLATDSIDERIADIVAIQLVYSVYISKINNSQPTVSQAEEKRNFFESVAQIFCNTKNTKSIDHDSDMDRLNQMVMNLEEFSEAFECPANSKMNPQKKCRLY